MRITLLSNRDLASCVALNALLPLLQGHSLRVFLSSRVGKAGAGATKPEALDTLKFFEQDLFNQFVFPAADRGESQTALQTFTGLERFLEAPIEELNDINGDGLARFAAAAPDLVLSIRYGVILREAAIAVPGKGVINLHSGRLPDYKGVMATFRALMHGDSELNMTLHTIDDSGIDTGKILGYSTLEVDPSRSYLWHVLGLYEQGCALLAQAVAKVAAGEALAGVEQATLANAGRYFTFPTQEELTAFTNQGWRLVDSDEVLALARQFTTNE